MDIKSAPAVDDFVVPALVPPAVGAASGAELKLTWSDCGDSSTHTKITGFTPSTITTGQKATMTGTGNLDEDVTGASFDLEMKTAVGTVSCKGDASQSKTCSLPLRVGSLTFEPMSLPIKKGSTSVKVDLGLVALLPGILAKTDTTVTATASNGDKLFCLNIKSAPAADVHPDRQAMIEEIQSTPGVLWKAALEFGEGGIDDQAVASDPAAKWSRAGDATEMVVV